MRVNCGLEAKVVAQVNSVAHALVAAAGGIGISHVHVNDRAEFKIAGAHGKVNGRIDGEVGQVFIVGDSSIVSTIPVSAIGQTPIIKIRGA